ncbi:hypothetical protein QTH90_24395 [Variovorax sp. J2P1-59]|uniref:hypothetical protein n=1 Tax=Variovorax flavidus TaxID=3053501 RepID=UPI002577108E|nr:hypothetical protein [Variovorax sp. J2P1-59]MDM0077569.1 hypothetical protein [Variovorax sp. J2P1-59]
MALAALTLLVACGGGGGGGGNAAALALAGGGVPGATTVTLNGVATYDSVPNTTGALLYAATAPKPVRGAVVDIVSAASSAIVATTTTDANGAYSVAVPSSTLVVVRVKAQMLQAGSGANWDVTVRDNTQSSAIYAMETPAFSTGVAAGTRNLHAPSGWGGSSYTSGRIAAPFALLDTVYTAQAKVLSVAPSTVFPVLRVFWSVNNLPADGNPTLGQIGTTFFSDSDGAPAIYVLGKEDVDTDEYDASVIAHEWGHYYQSAFSRDDSPGGSHSMTDSLDRRVAFSEGWGNAWSGIALGRGNYTDATGPRQAQGSNVDLATGASPNPGWYREASIHSILWKLNSVVGFKPIHDALTGAPFKSGLAVTSIHPFTAAFDAAAPAGASTLAGLLVAQNISGAANDPFGTLESNSGGISGVANPIPLYRSAAVGGSTSACVTNQAGPGNKLGDYVYLRFATPSSRNYLITVAGPAASDPDFVVYSGRKIAEATAVGTTETSSVGLPAGESVLVINDFNNSSAATCFTVTIQ